MQKGDLHCHRNNRILFRYFYSRNKAYKIRGRFYDWGLFPLPKTHHLLIFLHFTNQIYHKIIIVSTKQKSCFLLSYIWYYFKNIFVIIKIDLQKNMIWNNKLIGDLPLCLREGDHLFIKQLFNFDFQACSYLCIEIMVVGWWRV